MKAWLWVCVPVLLLLPVMITAAGQDPAPAGTADSPNETTVAATEAEANEPISAEMEALLVQIEQRGNELRSFQAEMLYVQQQLLTETATIRHGELYYQADDKTVRFRIHFGDYLQKDLEEETAPRPVKFDEDFAFDGLWITRRNDRTKSIQRRQVTRTPRKKEDFRLGKGPFPLPFAIRRADVVGEFTLELADSDPQDAAVKDTIFLILKPRPHSSYAEQYVRLDLWLAQKTTVPVRIRFETANAEITTITWTNIKTDKSIDPKQFQLKPGGADWDLEVIPLVEEETSDAKEASPANPQP
ncbi:MAG: hypothetical protein JW810_00790 [Sedimentisphaerales bacterium]|nr:hypothetical protein [Sedimentisphaerales bacterium]